MGGRKLMSTKKLIQTYRELLQTADLEITDDDCVSLRVPSKDKIKLVPLTIKGQRLVLPTKDHLKNPDWDERICFHPLSENIAAGESVVLDKYRACLNHRLNTVIPVVMLALLRIGASLDDQKKLDPEQAEFLPVVKNVDPANAEGKSTTIENFKAILAKMPVNTPTKQFVNIFLRRSAKLGDVSYFRAGVVHFPFYAELVKREGTVNGVKLRKKDYDVFIGLMEYLLPHLGETNYYSRGSDSRTGPSLDAIAKTVLALAGPINDVVARFGKLLPDDLEIPCQWAETFDNIGTLINEIREIPMLQGNEGTLDDEKPAAHAPVAAHAPAVAQEPTRAPVPGRQAGEYRAPVPGQQAQPRPQHDSKNTDLEQLLRSNPALAQQAGYRAQGWGGYQQPQQTRATLLNPAAPVGGGNQWNRGGGGWGRGGQGGGGFGGGMGGGGWRPSI